MTAPSAWSISAAMAAAQSALSRLQASGDVDTDEAAALAVLAEEAPDVFDVLLRVFRARAEVAGEAKLVAERMKELAARKARFERQHEEYHRTAYSMMEALGIRTWRHPELTASIVDGQPGVVITDETALPETFVRVKREPNKDAIKDAIKRGIQVPGAAMANGMPYLKVTP